MSPVYTCRIAVNGSETDTDVEADSAPWLGKITDLKMSGGGGSWWKTPTALACSFDVDVPAKVAHLIRTVTVAVQGPRSSVPAWGTTATGSQRYRVVFHGDVVGIKGVKGGNNSTVLIQVDALDELNGLMNRRAHLAADPSIGYKGVLDAIATAHSLTIAGSNQFPTLAQKYEMDMPKQKNASNGTLLNTVAAGFGSHVVAEWAGPITAPVMRWRPDFYDPAATSQSNRVQWTAGRPWSLAYPDFGIAWQDYIAALTVNGRYGSATPWGRAWLHNSAKRKAVGNRELILSTYLVGHTNTVPTPDTTWPSDAAKELMGRVGDAGAALLMKQLQARVEVVYADALADSGGSNGFDADPEDWAWDLATMMIGDEILPRSPFTNLDTGGVGTYNDWGQWPARAPYNGAAYQDLAALWQPTLSNTGVDTEVPASFVVRTITRTWDPAAGWDLLLGLDPIVSLSIGGSDWDIGYDAEPGTPA
jgi:hypothetical protein